tara:strand:- start:5104 stop:5667 length:564 start_codon:yes stop_codon:yes gene_type:complete
MVSVKGQLDAPLVDVTAMQQDYWERQEVKLPSLARLHKPKGWKKYFYKEQAPKLVLKRLKTSDWERINNDHYMLRKNITKDMPIVKKITAKMDNFKELTKEERAFLVDMDERTKPMMLSILTAMIQEPKMVYEEVVLMYEMLDEFDAKTLVAIVNSMTSEKASVTNAVTQERTAQINQMRQDLRTTI